MREGCHYLPEERCFYHWGVPRSNYCPATLVRDIRFEAVKALMPMAVTRLLL